MSADSSFETLSAHARDAHTGWSLGTFGALAEFHRTPEEPVDITEGTDRIRVATPRGALEVLFDERARIVPYEGLSKLPEHWMQGVVVCLPSDHAALGRRETLEEIGPDGDGILFDLGFGVPHVECCVRIDDETLAQELRRHAGQALLAPGNAAFALLKEASPPRIFISRLGRIEVHQEIPTSKPDGVTPEGPHTHVLADLLAHKRTHAANIPVPDGWLPCLAFYPPNPGRDGLGNPRPFHAAAHAAFQALMTQYAPSDVAALKRRVADAVAAGQEPDGPMPDDRYRRAVLRVTLRQLHHTHGATPALDAWRRFAEPVKGEADEADLDEAAGAV